MMVKIMSNESEKLWANNRKAIQVCSEAFKIIHDIKFPDVDPKTKESLIKNCMLDSVRRTTVKLHYEAIELVSNKGNMK